MQTRSTILPEVAREVRASAVVWSPVLPRRAAWFFAVGPLLITLVANPHLRSNTWQETCLQLTGAYAYAGSLGLVVHFLTDFALPRVLAPVHGIATRVVLVWLSVSCAIALATLALRPVIAWLDPGAWISLPTILTKGIVFGELYVVTGHAYQALRQRADGEKTRADNAHIAALEARLAALQARTNPHFLFNSLNAVMGLVSEDPVLAEDTLARLAALYRYTLHGSERRSVPLVDELEAVKHYLEIERARFGERLQYRFAVDPAVHEVVIPPMLVQPLVENAVLHGIGRRARGGEVLVSVTLDGGRLHVSVRNALPDEGAFRHRGNGISLNELRERLRLTYGAQATFSAGVQDAGCFEARLEIRLHP